MANEEFDRERLMDHDYDGIREYDNPLPAWWVWIFWASIIFCVPYWLYYQTADGHTMIDEYETEVASYNDQLLDMFGDLQADEATILRYMKDERALSAMDSVFQSKCASCHLPDGTGIVGPNLTDDHWINVRNVTDIHKTIVEGVPAKGMIAWTGILTDTQIVLMSSYIASLRANPKPGKPAQGEVIDPWPDVP